MGSLTDAVSGGRGCLLSTVDGVGQRVLGGLQVVNSAVPGGELGVKNGPPRQKGVLQDSYRTSVATSCA